MNRYPVSSNMVKCYLQHNDYAGMGNGYTLATWVHYNTHGRAKTYQGRYLLRMAIVLDDYRKKGLVALGDSVHGGTAWYSQPHNT